MSEAAVRQHGRRRIWAAPGGRHDRLIGALGVALPVAIGVLTAFLAMTPLRQNNELSCMLAKDNVEMAGERMRVEDARYSGADDRGRAFQLTAGSALQESSDDSILRLDDLSAAMELDAGRAFITANQGRYNVDTQFVALDGPVEFRAADGYALSTRDVVVDFNRQRMRSRGPVSGEIPLGTFSGNRMSVDLETRTVTLDGRARLRIVQGLGG